MSNQIQITGGAKVRALDGVITGTTGVLSSVPLGGANGVATLDSSGKVPLAQLPASVFEYKGTWNATTNTPYLVNGVGTSGWVYVVSVGGLHDFGAGSILFLVGDQVLYDGSIWERSSGATGTVTSVALTAPSAFNVSGSPITTSGTLAITGAGTTSQYINGAGSLTTFPSLTGFVPYTGATNDLNLGTHNLFANNLFDGFTNVAASGSQIVLTIASTPSYTITGSGGQTIKLPDATTLPNGAIFSFNNNQSSGAININNNSNTLVVSVPSGGFAEVVLLDNSIAAGSWDRHFKAPSNVSWSTNTLDYAGSITSATWNGNVVAINRGGTGSSTQNFVDLTTTQTIGGAKTFSSSLTASSLIKTGGTSSQFLKADGSVDSNSYITLTSLSFTAGSGAYNSTTGVITIPTNNNQITNGAGYTTNVGTVTSVAATGGTGISITGSPITTSGTITITNTAPDQTVALTASTGISVSGTYPNFTITNTSPSSGGTVTSVAALTIGTTGTDVSSSVANSTTTPVITLNIPDASATARGLITTGSQTIAGVKTFSSGIIENGGFIALKQTGSISTLGAGYFTLNSSAVGSTESLVMALGSGFNSTLIFNNAASYSYTFPSATGTIALTSQLTSGTVTSVGLSSATSGVTIGSTPVTSSGTITIAIATATTSQNGLLSSTDWTTFNGKQAALNGTGFVKASGTTISYDNSTYLTGNQTITLSGDVSGSGATAITTTIGALKVTNGMLAGTINYSKMDATTVPTWNQSTTGTAANITATSNATLTTLSALSLPYSQLTGTPSIPSVSGTANYVAKFTVTGSTIGNSGIYEGTSGFISIGNTNSTYNLDVTGTGRFSGASYSAYLTLDAPTAGGVISFRNGGTEFGTLGSELAYYGSGSATTLSLAANTSKSLILGAGGSRVLTLASTGAATFSAATSGNTLTVNGVAGSFATRVNGSSTTGSSYGIGIFAGTNSSDDSFRVHNYSGTEYFRVRGDGNVGIGTTSPTYLLDVNGTGRFSGTTSFTNGTAGIILGSPSISGVNLNFSYYSSSAASRTWNIRNDQSVYGDFAIQQSTTQSGNTFSNILYFSSTGAATFSGYVGINGAATIDAPLTVQGINSSSANNTITGSSADLYAVYVRQKGASAGISGANYMAQIISAAGAEGLEIYTPNSKELIFGTNSTERMRITSGGNVGIGTSTTNTLLNINIPSSSTNGLSLIDGSTVPAVFTYSSVTGENRIGGLLSYVFPTFYSGGSERMRITSGGNVLIGTTTDDTINKLQVNGSIIATSTIAAVVPSNVDMGVFNNTGATYTKSCVVASMTATGGTGSYFFYGQQSTSTVALKIFSNGNIQNTNNSYGAISDARLKENIIDATPKLADLMKVKVRNYNLIGESNKQLGVISQELEEIFPNMIEESTNLGENVKIKGVKYSVFVPMLIKAVQEQQEQINELKQLLNK